MKVFPIITSLVKNVCWYKRVFFFFFGRVCIRGLHWQTSLS